MYIKKSIYTLIDQAYDNAIWYHFYIDDNKPFWYVNLEDAQSVLFIAVGIDLLMNMCAVDKDILMSKAYTLKHFYFGNHRRKSTKPRKIKSKAGTKLLLELEQDLIDEVDSDSLNSALIKDCILQLLLFNNEI
jgi:hypothetical protein